MTRRIMKHNPAFLSPEELAGSFVARHEDLAFVLEHIADNTGASSQHLLIVAPRGMGKTTLVLRAAHAVRTEERFSKIWYPLVYAEETYEVTTAGELWLEGLRHLGEQTKNAELLEVHRELRREKDEQRLYDRALGRLIEFAEEHDKRILLVIENLHMLLGEQISEADAWKLRKTLQTERRLLLLATATASFDAIENAEQAFFDQFRTYRLEPLDLETARRVWAHVAGTTVSAEHMRPLHILTGGNPRLLTILASLAGGMSLQALMGDLVQLVDDHTTYFKSNLDSLPAKERKVYVSLADLWQPSTAREVAEQARLSPSEASALLNRLTQRGAVTASGEERRKLYQLTERMYNIYHLLRRSGGDESRVRAVVDFMVGFYDPVSLGTVVQAIAEEGAGLDEDGRRDHLLVLESLFRREANPRVRELWMKEIGGHVRSWPDAPASLREELERTASSRWIALIEGNGLPASEMAGVFSHCKELFGLLLNAAMKGEDTELLGQRLSEEDDVGATAAGVWFTLAGHSKRALPALRRALEGHCDATRRGLLLVCLGRCLMSYGQIPQVEAEKTFREAMALLPNEPGIIANLAWILSSDPHRSREAEEYALRAVRLNPSVQIAWHAMVRAYMKTPEPELVTRAAACRSLLRGKGINPLDQAAAGLLIFYHGAKSGKTTLVNDATRALQDAWKAGLRPSVVGHFLLKVAEVSGHAEAAKELLAHFSACFGPNDVEQAFSLAWQSDDPNMFAAAAPHLPILLADGFLGRALLPLIGLLIVLRRWNEARSHLQQQIPRASEGNEIHKPDGHAIQLWTQIFIDAAATGHAREALELITPSPLAGWLEPVVFALHAYLGQPHRAPLEVTEVGRDVVERIRRRAAALQSDAKAKSATLADTPSPTPPSPRRRTVREKPHTAGQAVRRRSRQDPIP